MKKKDVYLFFFFTLILHVSLHAQYCDTVSFQKIIWNQGIHDATIKNMFYNDAQSLYAVGETESAINRNKALWLLKLTQGGNVIWSKCVDASKDIIVNGIRRTTDGGFIIAANTSGFSKYSEGLIVKMDSNATIQWSFVISQQYSNLLSVTQLDDNSYIAAGTLFTDYTTDNSGNISSIKKSTNLVIKFDEGGNVLWWRSFRYNNLEQLRTSAQGKDGSLLVTGIETETGNGYMIKLNKDDGAVQWMNGYKSFNNNAIPKASSQIDGTFRLQVGNRIFFLTATGHYFDAKKIQLNSNKFNLDNTQVSNFGSFNSDTQLYDANLYPKNSPIVFAVQNDSVIVWAHQYKLNANNLQRITNAFAPDNTLFIAGSYVTSGLSDNTGEENLTYLIKADETGSTLCSDTFSVSFKVNKIAYPKDESHAWMNEGALQTQFVALKTEELSAKTMLDCDIQNCCKPFERDSVVSLCNGADYFLPPNDSLVKTTGTYSFHYLTTRGCDSTWNYNVNFKSLYTYKLNDTCLVNNQPVTFKLPFDSTANYMWQDGSTSKDFTATVPGKYWVNVTTACNIFRDTVNVNALCSLPVYIPSGFTPNGDGRNDVFKAVDLSGQRMISLSVYNRYGQNIFSSENENAGWDGTFNGINQPPGTYVYIFRYADLEGNLHLLKGTIVLIR